MKKIILSIALTAALGGGIMAQNPIIVEDFESNSLGWDEFSWKDRSGIIKNGYLELENKNAVGGSICYTDLPISVEQDFKLSGKIIVHKLSGTESFGVVIDTDEDLNQCAFLLREDVFNCVIFNNKTRLYEDERPVKFRPRKDELVEFVLERRGNQYIFSLNNMEVYRLRRNINAPTFGFYTDGNSLIRVDELIIEQDYSGEGREW